MEYNAHRMNMKKCLILIVFMLTAFAHAVGTQLLAAGGTMTDADIAAPVLSGSVRTTYCIVRHEVEAADRRADEVWLGIGTPAGMKEHQASLKAGMSSAIGRMPERSPLNAQTLRKYVRDGYTIEKVMFESHPNVHVTALLFLPDAAKFKAPRPGVIVTCGHSVNGKAFSGYQRTALLLAKAGFAALLYDPFDQGERIQVDGFFTTRGHNRIGVNATLLGWSMAGLRIWDGMCAIDYLQSRPEVDAERIGVCGQSGGGTMTSLIMAIDPRIRCAAPSCYLSTVRDVYGEIGPQDAEQNIFGQLSFGLNHLGLVLMRAPMPVLMNFKTADFFPFQGALETSANAKAVAARFGWTGRFCHVYGIGQHGWSEGNRRSTVDWMRQWLLGEEGAWDASGESYRAMDVGFDLAVADCGIPESEVSVAPGGNVRNIVGERTIYDIFRSELAAMRVGSGPGNVDSSVVSKRAGIRSPDETLISPVPVSVANATGGTIEKFAFVKPDGLVLPAVALIPSERRGNAVLLVADDGRAATTVARARELFAAGRTVLMLDVSGTGEIAVSPHSFYGAENSDEEVAVMLYALGRSLVGVRAEEMASAAAWLMHRFGGKVDVVADGRVCVAAHHARGAFPAFFGSIDDINAPHSWRVVVEGGERYPFACVVFGGLRDYDWPEL